MSYRERLEKFTKEYPYGIVEAGGAGFRCVFTGGCGKKDLVFLNGGMNMSEMWMDYVPALAPDYRVLIFDNPRELRTCEELADGIHALFQTLGIKDPILIGASFGGMVAQVIARRFPGETGGLILLSTGAMDRSTIRSLRRKYFMTPLLLKYMEKCSYDKLKPKLIKAGSAHARNESPEDRKYVEEMFTCLFEDYTREKDLHATGLLWDLTKLGPVVPEDFSCLSGRILLILPDGDFFSKKMQRSLIALMHGPEIICIKGGHVHTVLHPEVYLKAIREFLERI